MANSEQVIGLTGLGAGIIIVFAAVKNKSPLALLKNALGNPVPVLPLSTPVGIVPSNTTQGFTNPTGNTGITTISDTSGRAQALVNRTIQPDLVSIGSQPMFRLDRIAAQSFAQVEAAYGKRIPITGSYRSYAQQAAAYALNPGRFAPPGHSLHEVGLAVDVNSAIEDDPSLVNAFTSNGWFRAAKIINGRHEPWHWSYGVPG